MFNRIAGIWDIKPAATEMIEVKTIRRVFEHGRLIALGIRDDKGRPHKLDKSGGINLGAIRIGTKLLLTHREYISAVLIVPEPEPPKVISITRGYIWSCILKGKRVGAEVPAEDEDDQVQIINAIRGAHVRVHPGCSMQNFHIFRIADGKITELLDFDFKNLVLRGKVEMGA